jgi:hypothetical protein
MAADFAATSVDVDAISTPAAPEAHVVVLDLARHLAGTITTAEHNVFALDCAELRLSGSRLLAAADSDVRLVPLKVTRPAACRGIQVPYAGGRRGRTTAAHRASVVVKAAAGAARACSRKGVFIAATNDHGAGGGAVVVVVEEVRSATPRVCASTATKLDIELLIVAAGAVVAAVEVPLALLIELGGRVASRHVGSGRQERGRWAGGWDDRPRWESSGGS